MADAGGQPQLVVLDDMVGEEEGEWEDDSGGEEAQPSKPAPWVPYRDRPEWVDVTPIPQNDGPFSVVLIKYTLEFKDTMDYFRAVMKAGEKSQRALNLTAEVVRLNPSNYIGWWYRRQCLFKLQADLQKELAWMQSRLLACPKNYQMWFHRRELLTVMKCPNVSEEKRLINRALKEDAKNYHSWCHRRWLVQHFGAYAKELGWVNAMIGQDVRNNSAWNYRFFLQECHVFPGLDEADCERSLKAEFEAVAPLIRQVPHNESPYNYVVGLARLAPTPPARVKHLRDVVGLLLDVAAAHKDCPLPRATLLQCLGQMAALSSVADVLEGPLAAWLNTAEANHRQALELARELQYMDGIRAKYWAYHQQRLEGELRRLADV